MAQPPLQLTETLHPSHHRSVKAHTHVKAEVPTVDVTQPDAPDGVVAEARQQLNGCPPRLVLKPQLPGKYVGGPPGQHPQCGWAADQTVGHLVDGTVAAQRDHHLHAPGRRPLGKASGMTATMGLHHFQLVLGGEGILDDHPIAGGDT